MYYSGREFVGIIAHMLLLLLLCIDLATASECEQSCCIDIAYISSMCGSTDFVNMNLRVHSVHVTFYQLPFVRALYRLFFSLPFWLGLFDLLEMSVNKKDGDM